MSKLAKKDLQIMIDEKLGQLFFGDKKKNIRLLMLRPIDLIEFSEFAGTNADDILIWVGKSLGKGYIDNLFSKIDWSKETMETKKEVFLAILEALELMGYGHPSGTFKKDHILIEVEEPLASDELENIIAKNLCLIYLGFFTGIFDALLVDVDGEEIDCVLLGDDKCAFKFQLISEELEEKLVDKEPPKTYSFSLRDL